MKRITLTIFLLLFQLSLFAQSVSILSWNLKDFGNTKTDQQLTFIAKTVKNYDVVAIQEVVASLGGYKALSKLMFELNKGAQKWDFALSAITTTAGTTKERYAFIWKIGKVAKVGAAWLDQNYQAQIEREPFFCRFKIKDKTFTVGSFHAVPKAKHPETEIKYFQFLPALYPKENLIFCGDFNLPQNHSVFTPLRKMNYVSALVDQKTSLRQKCIENDCLASEYDNFFYNQAKLKMVKSGIVAFYQSFKEIKEARKISDHVPIFSEYAF